MVYREILQLRTHIEMVLNERDRRYEDRFEGQEKAVGAALQAAKEAVQKAEVAAEKRFDAVNEFRAQLADQASTFMPRLEAENRIHQNAEKIADVADQVQRMEALKQGGTDARVAIYALAGFIVSLLVVGTFVAAVWPHK